MRNVHISDKQDASMQQAEGSFKWLLLAFLFIAWFTREHVDIENGEVIIYRETIHPAQHSASTWGLISEWFE